jgi:hypothetical protein
MKLVVSGRVGLAVDAARTFAAATDWESQGEWIPATRVSHVSGLRDGVGGVLKAFTGIGRVGFLDTMEITAWDAPRSCRVLHKGRIVRGTALFAVEPVGTNRSIFVWTEELDIPGPTLLLRPVRPLLAVAWRIALRMAVRRFARWVSAEAVPSAR